MKKLKQLTLLMSLIVSNLTLCDYMDIDYYAESEAFFLDSSLRDAAKAGSKRDLAQLLEHGAEINSHDIYGRTALMQAIRYGHLDCVQLLAEKGAEITSPRDPYLPSRCNSNSTGFMVAAFFGKPDILDYLLGAYGPSTLFQRDCFGRTALSIAKDGTKTRKDKELFKTCVDSIERSENLATLTEDEDEDL